VSHFRDVFLFVLEERLGEVNVLHGVLDVSVPEKVLDMERNLRAPSFHGCSEVAHCFEAYVQ
jgi:hypothetical protein